MINVAGKVRNPFRFELTQRNALGSELVNYALPLAKVSHVGVIGDRESGPFSVYLPYKDFTRLQLKDGDKVLLMMTCMHKYMIYKYQAVIWDRHISRFVSKLNCMIY